MLTHRMTSVQTGPEGVPVSVLLVAPGVDIAKEYYLGMTLDRTRNTVTMIASAEGGVDIEDGVRWQPRRLIGFVANKILTTDEQRVSAYPTLVSLGAAIEA